MAIDLDKAFEVFENTYLKMVSTPTIDMTADQLKERAEVVHDVSLKILKLENANFYELQAAYEIQGAKMKLALQTLEEATKANTDAMTFIHSVNYGLQMMSSFFPMF